MEVDNMHGRINSTENVEVSLNASPVAVAKGVRITIRMCQIVLLTACLAVQQHYYAKTEWSIQCGYDYRVWSTVGLSVLLLVNVLALIPLYYPAIEAPHPLHSSNCLQGWSHAFKLLNLMLCLFQLTWFIRGGLMLFVLDQGADTSSCAKVPWIWSLAIWSCQAFMYFTPCFLVILIVPCMLGWLVFVHNAHGANHRRTPDEILARLGRKKYSEVIAEGLNQPVQHSLTSGVEAAVPVTRTTSTGILNALPDVMGVTNLLTRLGSGTSAARAGERANMLNSENICAICVGEFEMDDVVIIMPCDARHIFHEGCVVEWLSRSEQCPMCRQNVVEIMEDQVLP